MQLLMGECLCNCLLQLQHLFFSLKESHLILVVNLTKFVYFIFQVQLSGGEDDETVATDIPQRIWFTEAEMKNNIYLSLCI